MGAVGAQVHIELQVDIGEVAEQIHLEIIKFDITIFLFKIGWEKLPALYMFGGAEASFGTSIFFSSMMSSC